MRYMGAKGKLLGFIEYGLNESGALTDSKTFADVFAGTASVGRYFKEKELEVFSSDIMYMSYVLQEAYIANSVKQEFSRFGGYAAALEYLDGVAPINGYVWRHFTTDGTAEDEFQRMFFIPENGKKIDAIRNEIEKLKTDSEINSQEYFILLATLLESISFYSNVSGVYSAFLKNYDPRALKDFKLRPIEYSQQGKGHAHHSDGLTLLQKNAFDIVYLDPPYNQRQYAPNYHVIETIAKWDNPLPRGKAGIREYSELKSNFCSKSNALLELEKYASQDSFKYLALSYNSESIMEQEDIIKILSLYGTVDVYEQEYLRFKSNNNGDSAVKKHVNELLFILKK